MHSQSLTIEVSPSVGTISAEYIVPEKSSCLVTLAHGAGAGMNHSFMLNLATSLAGAGLATLRFNFPFTENKKKRPDFPAVAHKTIEAALLHAHTTYPSLPLFVSGKSFGGRMSSQFLALDFNPVAKGIIFYGFPLHPAGKPSIDRADHLKDVPVPMLFLQGTRDELATIDLIEAVCSSLSKATLIKIEGADHAFKAGKQDVVQVLVDYTKDWTKNIMGG